jgi:hypothetical protein
MHFLKNILKWIIGYLLNVLTNKYMGEIHEVLKNSTLYWQKNIEEILHFLKSDTYKKI